MKKQPPATKIEDQTCPRAYRAQRRSHERSAKDLYSDPTPAKPRRKISYLLGETPREEPAEMPRLFIRGVVGGSIKMDLRGLDIELSEPAFAHWVADESLKHLHIHRGDIAVIDPMRPVLRDRNLVLVDLNGREVLRRLAKKNRVWFLETADGTKPEPVPLLDHPLHGVVLGVLRLFTNARAIKYRGTDANFAPRCERSSSSVPTNTHSREANAKSAHSMTLYPRRKQRALILAAERPPEYLLSEVEPKPGYSV